MSTDAGERLNKSWPSLVPGDPGGIVNVSGSTWGSGSGDWAEIPRGSPEGLRVGGGGGSRRAEYSLTHPMFTALEVKG